MPHEFLVWDTGHSFMNEDQVLRDAAKYPVDYDPAVAKKSMDALIAFFDKHLKT